MSRLIDADELIKYIKIWEIGTSISSDQKEFIDCINSQPTAFDMEKVAERLEKEMKKAKEEVEKGHGILIKEPYTPYIKAIEIVKGGGVE